jgi:hypothetical protein
MSESRIQNQQSVAKSEYEDKLAQAIAQNEELRREMRKLSLSWETERSQLKTRIVQLEHSLVDAIERSNNPLRTKLISEEKIRLVEEVKREWSAQWDAERKHLLAELNRLRSSFEQTDSLRLV